MNYIRSLVIAVASLATVISASAWGPEGHEIVGRIAELHLTPKTAQAVKELFAGNGDVVAVHISDGAIANWADHIRRDRAESAPWHFVDIPFDADRYDAERDCTNHQGCVVDAVMRFAQTLANTNTDAQARVEALKFLVHFVGDIHQPLHCGERNGDKGGNLCLVEWPGDPKPIKLHAVWDGQILRKSLREKNKIPLTYADRLDTEITPRQLTAWQAGTPAVWAWESHQIAVRQVYAGIPAGGPPHRLSHDYIREGQSIVDEQLSKAGLRLARLLNDALGK